MAPRRRHFGRIRRLPSGRWQARYPGPDGVLRPAPHTFRTKGDATAWLSCTETELRSGDWQDSTTGQIMLAEYAAKWIAENPRIKSPRTRELYEDLLRLHILPILGTVMLADLRLPDVRAWRADRLDAGAPELQVAKAYRLLRAILNTAMDDELIRRNPCRIKGAGKEDIAERPTMAVVDVLKVAEAIQPRYRALVLLAAFTQLRFGELMFLRRRDIQVDGGVLWVRKSVAELRRPGSAGTRQVTKDTKAAARSLSPTRSSRSSAFTWPSSPRPVQTAACSSAPRVRPQPVTTSTGSGRRPAPRHRWSTCAFTTCGTPAGRWPPGPGPRCVS
jgi:hypothetical protein